MRSRKRRHVFKLNPFSSLNCANRFLYIYVHLRRQRNLLSQKTFKSPFLSVNHNTVVKFILFIYLFFFLVNLKSLDHRSSSFYHPASPPFSSSHTPRSFLPTIHTSQFTEQTYIAFNCFIDTFKYAITSLHVSFLCQQICE